MVSGASLGSRLWRSTARELGIQTLVLLSAAGTLAYWQAWTTMGLRLVPVVVTNLYLVRKDQALLERRLAIEEEGEKEGVHKLYCSSVVELREGQTVVATGPYRLVRHPMYSGALLGIAAMPLALGSYAAAMFVLPLCAVFVMRIQAEEKFLSVELPGYAAYMRATRRRLVPGVW